MQPIQDADLLAELEGKKKSKPVRGQVRDARLLAELNAAPETAAQTLGRSSASLADTLLGIPGAIVSPVVYAGARAFGQSPEQAQQTAGQFEWQDRIGKLAGVTGTAGYEQAPLRSAGRAIGETVGETVIQPIAEATGLPEQDVANMVGTAAMGLAPGAGRLATTTGKGVVAGGKAVGDVAGGALGRGLNMIAAPGETPKLGQTQSSRIPLGETYITPQGMAELKSGMPTSEANIRPTAELGQTLPGKIALGITGGEVPVAGQAARAFGERIGETYRNPLTAAMDIGTAAFTGVPFYTAKQAATGLARGAADWYLGRKGFSQLSPAERAALEAGQNPWATSKPATTTTPAAPAAMSSTFKAEDIIPPTTAPQVWKNPRQPEAAATATPPGQAIAPTPLPETPAPTAAVKTAEQIKAEQDLMAAGKFKKPEFPQLKSAEPKAEATPEVKPEVKPEPSVSPTLEAKLAEVMKKAEERRAAARKKPGGAMEMKANPPTFASKEEFLKQRMMDEMKNNPIEGSYIEGNRRIEYTTESTPPFKRKIVRTEYDAKTGKKLKSTIETLGKRDTK